MTHTSAQSFTTARQFDPTSRRPIVLLEFNELSPTLITNFISEGHLPNFKRLRDESQTWVTDAEEAAPNLEPWIQWVTVHSGLSYDEHGIFHLGDGDKLKVKCIWDLASDAGMPVISDPGYRLVHLAVRHNIPVVPIPGASALVAALSAAGLPIDKFRFYGFLPSKKSQRRKALEEAKDSIKTLVFYEAPHRVLEMLEDLREILSDPPVVVAREVTKVHEEFTRGSASEVLAQLNDQIVGQEVVEFDLAVERSVHRVDGDGEERHQRPAEVEAGGAEGGEHLPLEKAVGVAVQSAGHAGTGRARGAGTARRRRTGAR